MNYKRKLFNCEKWCSATRSRGGLITNFLQYVLETKFDKVLIEVDLRMFMGQWVLKALGHFVKLICCITNEPLTLTLKVNGKHSYQYKMNGLKEEENFVMKSLLFHCGGVKNVNRIESPLSFDTTSKLNLVVSTRNYKIPYVISASLAIVVIIDARCVDYLHVSEDVQNERCKWEGMRAELLQFLYW